MDGSSAPKRVEEAPSAFTALPIELQREIVHCVSKQSHPGDRLDDIQSLCLTNKTLYGLALPCLRSVSLLFIRLFQHLHQVPTSFGKDNSSLRHIKELTLAVTLDDAFENDQQQACDSGTEPIANQILASVQQGTPATPGQEIRTSQPQGTLPVLTPYVLDKAAASMVLEALLPNTLLRFDHAHTVAIDISTLDCLFQTQQKLRSLSLKSSGVGNDFNILPTPIFSTYPTALEELQVTFTRLAELDPISTVVAAQELVEHCRSLRTLSICDSAGVSDTEDHPLVLGASTSILRPTMSPVNLTLEYVTLSHQNEEAEHGQLFDMKYLKTLRLRSCRGVARGFTRMAGVAVTLRNLEVGLEEAEPDIVPAVHRFLVSFRGLRRLVYVFFAEAPDQLLPVEAINHHGGTLQSLVIDVPLRAEDLEYTKQQIWSLCRSCQRLRLLALPFPDPDINEDFQGSFLYHLEAINILPVLEMFGCTAWPMWSDITQRLLPDRIFEAMLGTLVKSVGHDAHTIQVRCRAEYDLALAAFVGRMFLHHSLESTSSLKYIRIGDHDEFFSPYGHYESLGTERRSLLKQGCVFANNIELMNIQEDEIRYATSVEDFRHLDIPAEDMSALACGLLDYIESNDLRIDWLQGQHDASLYVSPERRLFGPRLRG